MGEIRHVQWSQLRDKLGDTLFNCLLMRCGGQQSFTPEEISETTKAYTGSVIAIEIDTCNIMMTLKTRENDEPNI